MRRDHDGDRQMSDPNIHLDGPETGPGPVPKPLKTLAKAVEEVRAENAPAADPLRRDPGLGAYDPNSLPPDPFDPENLRVRQDYSEGMVEKLLLKVPVRAPNQQDFIRVHPDPKYRVELPLIIRKDDNELYVVAPELRSSLINETVNKRVYLAINQQGNIFLWPVGMPGPDGKLNEWHASADQAAEIAMKLWVRVRANKFNRGYDVIPARGIIPEPNWPKETFGQLLRVAFESYYVNSPDHPLVRKLEGF
jgi:hypothetical protein